MPCLRSQPTSVHPSYFSRSRVSASLKFAPKNQNKQLLSLSVLELSTDSSFPQNSFCHAAPMHPHFCPNQSIHLETETINIYEQCGLFSAVPLYPLVFGGAPKGSSFKVNSDGQRNTKMEQRSTCLFLLEEMSLFCEPPAHLYNGTAATYTALSAVDTP